VPEDDAVACHQDFTVDSERSLATQDWQDFIDGSFLFNSDVFGELGGGDDDDDREAGEEEKDERSIILMLIITCSAL
jgi:hypothetical protein